MLPPLKKTQVGGEVSTKLSSGGLLNSDGFKKWKKATLDQHNYYPRGRESEGET